MTAIAGTLYSPNMCAVTYLVFLIFVPGLYVNRPTGCITTTVLSGVIFCFMSAYFKTDTYIISVDIINTIFSIVVGIIFNLYNINIQLENLQAAINLEKQSITDELTSLPNRRCFNINIGDYFGECKDSDMTIFMFDIDYFKKYNDEFGHLKGDECLSLIGKCLMKIAQENDIFVARYGGEEFVTVSRHNNENQVREIANAIVKNIRALGIPNPNSSFKKVTVSVGYATSKGCKAENYMQLINFADEALYMAKNQGRNLCIEYNNKAI